MSGPLAGLLAAGLAQALPAAPMFQPIDGQQFRYLTRQSRDDGHATRLFMAERLVVFRRMGGGWRATVVLTRASAPDGGEIGAMFQSAMAALAGRPILFDLDAAGRVLAVDGLAEVWRRAVDGLAAMADARAPRQPDAAALGARLQAIPEARQLQIMASILDPLIDGAAGQSDGVRHVTVPAASPFGARMMLEGEESVSRKGDGTIAITTRAQGTVPPLLAPDMPAEALAAGGAAAGASVSMTATRAVDAATGLVRHSRAENRSCTGPPDRQACLSTVTDVTLTPVVL